MHNLRSRGTVRHTSYPYRLVKRLLGQHGGHDAGQTAGGGGVREILAVPDRIGIDWGCTGPDLSRGAGPLRTLGAGLLYCGSGLCLGLIRLIRDSPTAHPQRRELPPLVGAIVFDGIVGPVLMTLGLSNMSASGASLLLKSSPPCWRGGYSGRTSTAGSPLGCSPSWPRRRLERFRPGQTSAAHGRPWPSWEPASCGGWITT
jgi:hypothetical protein